MARVCVDPGHGGSPPSLQWDPGAVRDGIREADIALQIADKVARALSQAGHEPVMTRRDDTYVGLQERADIANAQGADRFVSIHCNSHETEEPKGYEVLHYPGSPGEQLAGYILDELRLALPEHEDRGPKPRGDLTVLRATRMPAVLVEVEFLSHPRMRELLQDVVWQTTVALAIARGAVG